MILSIPSRGMALVVLLCSWISLVLAEGIQVFPTVDLGVSLIQAQANLTAKDPYYKFMNIRYAEPPIGDLRFAPPVAPTVRNATVNDGKSYTVCPQAVPAWVKTATQWIEGVPLTSLNATTPFTPSSIPPVNVQTSEDCLFLDVIVPESVFNGNTSAPVLIWLYGGGFGSGSKNASGNPAGLLEHGFDDNQDGFIWVAMNYRLGLFGWLSGDDNITSNAGLLDQRMAFDWVQDNIALFGGDPNRVTVMGESAGAGSILHHITAYGGRVPAPFSQAILQSPAYQPTLASQGVTLLTETLSNASYLSNSSVTTVQDLRELSFQTLFQLNAVMIGNSPYGSFGYGPIIDGSYVPDFPSVSLQNGNFDPCINVMVGHNSAEGLLYTSPFIDTQAEFVSFFEAIFPNATESVISYITETLYPNDFSGAYGYTNQVERTSQSVADYRIVCNARFLDLGYQNETYAYLFSVPPGIHGFDVSYTFYNDAPITILGHLVNSTLAALLQDYIVNFVMTSDPGNAVLPLFPTYGTDSIVKNITLDGTNIYGVDPAANARCDWWQTASYAPVQVVVEGGSRAPPPSTPDLLGTGLPGDGMSRKDASESSPGRPYPTGSGGGGPFGGPGGPWGGGPGGGGGVGFAGGRCVLRPNGTQPRPPSITQTGTASTTTASQTAGSNVAATSISISGMVVGFAAIAVALAMV